MIHKYEYIQILNTVSWSSPHFHSISALKKYTQCKIKAIPVQVWIVPEGSRRVRIPDLTTIGLLRWQICQPYTPAAFTPRRKFSWCSFPLEAESTPRPQCGQKFMLTKYSSYTIGNLTCFLPTCSALPQPTEPSCAHIYSVQG